MDAPALVIPHRRALRSLGSRVFAAQATAIALTFVTACRDEGSARLQGHWRGIRAESNLGDAGPESTTFALGATLEVRGDVLTITTPKSGQSGRYRVLRDDGTSVTITTDLDGPDASQTFAFEDGGTLRWLAAPGRALVFVKD